MPHLWVWGLLVSALVTAAITAMLRRAGKVDRHGVPSGGWLLGCFIISWFAAAPVFVRAKTLGAQGGDGGAVLALIGGVFVGVLLAPYARALSPRRWVSAMAARIPYQVQESKRRAPSGTLFGRRAHDRGFAAGEAAARAAAVTAARAARDEGYVAGMAAGRVEAERTHAKHANGAQAARKAGYDEGYQQGKTDGEREGFERGKAAAPAGWSGAQLDQHRIRQLLNLCHPDKHGNSPASNTVTQWLNGVLKEMRG